MAQIWLHNEMLQVEGKKMSKSLGNFFTVRDLLDQGVPGEVIRFVFLGTHYSKPMDWTEAKAKEARGLLHDWHRQTMELHPTPNSDFKPSKAILGALADDLNTHQALVHLRGLRNDPQRLLDNARFLGLLLDEARNAFRADWLAFSSARSSDKGLAGIGLQLDEMRKKALQTKDFSKVDLLKKQLTDAGAKVQISREGVSIEPGPNFDPSKLEGLL
jgi:cysteinyl-tRNA synthetase